MNITRKFKYGAGVLAIAVILLAISTVTALASGNDNLADATVISEFPFLDSSNTSEATIALDDPWTCAGQYKSIWYTYTPESNASLTISASTDYGYYTTLSIYRVENEGLVMINCLDWEQVSTTLGVTAGTTYYFELMVRYTGGSYPYPDPPNDPDGGNVTFDVTQIFPPANDDFANASMIPDTTYSDTVDTTYASIQAGEPSACGWNFQQTIWYSFTPATTGSYTMQTDGVYPVLAVYSGSDFDTLQVLDCRVGWGWSVITTLTLEGGTTYHIQTYAQYPWEDPQVTFSMYPPPPPLAIIGYWPGDPMKNEGIQFSSDSYDPGGLSIDACSWDFGDGSSGTDCYPIHAYAVDGDYTVQLAVTTYDGRTASTTQTVQVRSHDVGINRFVVPTTARVGQSKQISVYVKNLSYSETVQVDLYKSTVNGYELIGSLTQEVPIRPPSRAQVFTFDYTFTSQDGALGKVTFQAIATIINARDVYPPDNVMNSLATKVAR